MKVMERLKRENKRLRETNEELREELSELVKEVNDLKQEGEQYSYDHDHGWGSDLDHRAEEIEEIDPAEVEEQTLKISRLLEEVDNG